MQQQRETYSLKPIGRISRRDDAIVLEIDILFRPALKDLSGFSHVMVFWWADAFDNDEDRAKLHIKPPYAPDRSIGVFATRSPFRPNPIAMTTCPIVSLDEEEGLVIIGDIDAFDGTPVIDIKCYSPGIDRVAGKVRSPWKIENEHIPDGGVTP